MLVPLSHLKFDIFRQRQIWCSVLSQGLEILLAPCMIKHRHRGAMLTLPLRLLPHPYTHGYQA